MSWLEVNVKGPSTAIAKNDFLIVSIKPILDKVLSQFKIKSWHFLWQGKPYPSTLRLRFLEDTPESGQLREFLKIELRGFFYCFGRHGDCNIDYEGEVEDWGKRGWEKMTQFMQVGSEFALELVENKERLKRSDEYTKTVFEYADRYTHLFLNQIEPLLIEKHEITESDFDLEEGVARYVLEQKQIELPPDKRKKIVSLLKQEILASLF